MDTVLSGQGNDPITKHFRLHNEMDQEVVACEGCLEDVNSGIVDDRERMHSPVEVHGLLCELCGE